MTLDYYNNQVKIFVGTSTKHLRLETLHHYLPGYLDLLNQHGPRVTSPDKLFRGDRITCKALRYLFEFLEEVDQGFHTSTALSEWLNNPWDSLRHGPNESTNLFMALGNVLHMRNFGCGPKLRSMMTAYVIRHCADIVCGRIDGWIDHVNVLEGIGTDPTDLAQVLSYVINEHHKNYFPFLNPRSDGRLSGSLRELLTELIFEREERHARARQQCERCNQRRALGPGDWRMISLPKIWAYQGTRGRRSICSDCTRRKQLWPDRNHYWLESDAMYQHLLRDEPDYFGDLWSGRILRRC